MNNILKYKKFSDINLNDPFFDSLKSDYQEFIDWFQRKSNDYAYIFQNENFINGFLYLKVENGPINDVDPPLSDGVRLKIGTMKINPHGTRLGERFIKKAFDHAISNNLDEIYVTVFSKHESLISLFIKYGFVINSKKITSNGEELVLIKSLNKHKGDILLDYPKINLNGTNKYLLSIYPEFHTRLFPDSILRTENFDIIKDISHTNSIHKMYICKMNVTNLKKGDVLVIYRTSDQPGRAWYRAVATSICVVEELRSKSSFKDIYDFINYCKSYSIFTQDELEDLYENSRRFFVIKLTYNIALRKRLTRGKLITEVGLNESNYWGFMKLNDEQFKLIKTIGGVNESLTID